MDVKNSPHIYSCSKKTKENRREIKFDYISYNFPEISEKNVLFDYYVNKKYSLPMLKELYNIDSKSITFLLDYYGIERRNISESSILISVNKQKKTLRKKYGVDNISQIRSVKEKKKKTTLKNYGVDNIWKHKDYSKIVEQSILHKYGIERKELMSINAKAIWENKTPDEKKRWLENSIHSMKSIRSVVGYRVSKLENIIANLLNELSIPYETQFFIKEKNKGWKLYDFKIKNTNIIIEVNGDYWHANPKIYKQSDVIKYVYGDKTVEDIWNKDKKKQYLAESKGYVVRYIWEHDIKNLNKKELINYVLKIIKTDEN
ncbi:MAG: DUF7487 domain-containing protein [bacterium]